MKVIVEFSNDAHTSASVLMLPGWLGRLFGARARRGDASQGYGGQWFWDTTQREVPGAVMRQLSAQTVVPPPDARIVGGGLKKFADLVKQGRAIERRD